MSAGPPPTRTPAPADGEPAGEVRWVLDHDTAEDLTRILGLLEDFLRHASRDAIDELAGYQQVRPLDPNRWADWLADHLGDQLLALRAATTTATTTWTGEPR